LVENLFRYTCYGIVSILRTKKNQLDLYNKKVGNSRADGLEFIAKSGHIGAKAANLSGDIDVLNTLLLRRVKENYHGILSS
jgi:hypothetical protein